MRDSIHSRDGEDRGHKKRREGLIRKIVAITH